MKKQKDNLDYRESYIKYKRAIDKAGIVVWEWNIKENELFFSDELTKIMQYDLNDVSNLLEFIGKFSIPKDRESAINDLNFFMEGRTFSYRSEFRIVTKKSEIKKISLKGNMIKDDDGEVLCLFGIINDITEEREKEKSFIEIVYYDQLTDLPNRAMFLMDIKNIICNTIQLDQKGALIFIDIDNFKSINDTLGHDHGDLMLKIFSQLLKICVKDYGKLYRLGGDEFIILIDKFDSLEIIEELCDNILNYCQKPFELNEKQLYITTSIGVSIFPQDSIDMNDLLKFADLAMYESKARGKNTYTFFEQALNKAYTRKILIENELKNCLRNNELSIVYQPQINSINGKIVAFEALLRWNSKKLGFISPTEFIPLAEKNGMIVDIGDWVLNKVCKKICEYRQKKYKFNNIAINVSPIQIKEDDFKDKIIRACNEYEVPLNLLEIEITERTLIELNDEKINDLEELIRKEISISIDDFGTGYSSLSYLTMLPINTLKIDKSFIDKIEEEKNRAVIECIIRLSKILKYKVIAEGVEIKKQLEMLTTLGCNIIQGYYFSKPVSEEELEVMLKNN